MQTHLYDISFQVALYEELKNDGYTDRCKCGIMDLLQDGRMHSIDSVAHAGGKQYNARILELRRDGHNIKSLRIGRKFYYQMSDFKVINKNDGGN